MTAPPAPMHESLVRQAAAQAVVHRFHYKPFVWGTADCLRLSALLLRGMGHKVSLAKAGAYSSGPGAARALARNGYADMGEALDGFGLLRMPHAYVRIADLVGLPAVGGALGIGVYLGNHRVICFVEGLGHVGQPHEIATAWRVPCLK